jgi:uncharacterized protein DUF7019
MTKFYLYFSKPKSRCCAAQRLEFVAKRLSEDDEYLFGTPLYVALAELMRTGCGLEQDAAANAASVPSAVWTHQVALRCAAERRSVRWPGQQSSRGSHD